MRGALPPTLASPPSRVQDVSFQAIRRLQQNKTTDITAYAVPISSNCPAEFGDIKLPITTNIAMINQSTQTSTALSARLIETNTLMTSLLSGYAIGQAMADNAVRHIMTKNENDIPRLLSG